MRQIKRICFFAPHILPLLQGSKEGFGGAEQDLWQIARRLSQSGEYDITILALGTENREFAKEQINVKVLKKYSGIGSFFQKIIFLMRLIGASISLSPDIYFTKLASWEIIIIFFLSRLTGSKFVYRLQSDLATNKQSIHENLLFNRITTELFVFVLKHADKIIAQTNTQKELLDKNFGINSEVIYNAHSIPEKIDFGLRTTNLWVARAHPAKRPEIFLGLVSRFPQYEFVMVMPQSATNLELFNETKSKASKLANLQFIPGLSSDEIEKQYHRAKTVIITSDVEGFSNVLVEASKNGCPVVSFTYDPDNIIQKNNLGFCANGDFEKFCQRVQLLNGDSRKQEDLGQNAHNFALKNLNIDVNISRYKALLEDLLL
jgi:glycosyltransferase involved in cell wall biosynthesis